MPKSNIRFIPSQNKSVIVRVCFVLFIVCLYICVCECLFQNNNFRTKFNLILLQNKTCRGPLRACRSIRSGTSGLPDYCAPLVCVSVVMDVLAGWRHNKPKSKPRKESSCSRVRSGEEEEKGIGVTSDIVMVKGEDPDSPRSILAS